MNWNSELLSKAERIQNVKQYCQGKIVKAKDIVNFLENIIRPEDKLVLEGDNQKQADFLAKALVKMDPEKVHNLNMIIPSISLDEHLDLFDKGIAEKIDFSFAGLQSVRLAKMLKNNQLKIGAINTYLELYGRLLVDLTPNVCLVAADKADLHGNLYTGCNTEETPTLTEAAAYKNGIVVAQVNSIVDSNDLPRVDIPGDWIDYIVEAPQPYPMEPLFTRDPALIRDTDILMGMMVIKGIYAKHGVTSLNHGIGFNGAAIELLLPTYGESLGLKNKICTHWILNPHPTLIPAIESGWVKQIFAFGSEVGMGMYTSSRPDIFFTGKDGSLRSNRTLAQVAGLYGVDLFLGATLQMDYVGNSSTVVADRLTGFGGAPNMGHNSGGRRHSTPAWFSASAYNDSPLLGGRKIVVQVMKSQGKKGANFVPELDAIKIGRSVNLPVPPIMIYGNDVTHAVTEQGIAYLYLAHNEKERTKMLACIAQGTPLGDLINKKEIEELRSDRKIVYPKDLGISKDMAQRDTLAAKSLDELVEWSGGLYEIPDKFKKQLFN